MEKKISEALGILKTDIHRNISFINFIKNNPVTGIEIIGKTVIAKGISDHEWVYICCGTKNELEQLLNHAKKNQYFAVIEDWMLSTVARGREIEWKLTTRRYILPDVIDIKNMEAQISNLRTDDADYILENSKYKDFLSVEYIIQRIQKGESCCLREKDKPIAWLMTQDDGALGFLTVLPEYQKKGYAKLLLNEIITRLRKKGEIPFAYVEDSNEKAVQLINRFGFTKDRLVHWIKLVN